MDQSLSYSNISEGSKISDVGYFPDNFIPSFKSSNFKYHPLICGCGISSDLQVLQFFGMSINVYSPTSNSLIKALKFSLLFKISEIFAL